MAWKVEDGFLKPPWTVIVDAVAVESLLTEDEEDNTGESVPYRVYRLSG